ncbi:hypothetical protein DL771_008990 [Monosporascus sp. 5C6A]|nr:hypothetical protein DL771_008990 [Monosporascus sp. 5C6A]
MRLSPATAAVLTASLARLALAVGPCDINECDEVMDSSGCWNYIIFKWDGKDHEPEEIFDCVEDDAILCSVYLLVA